jgi:uncharacterized membrane protein
MILKKTTGRFWEIDFIRGFAIILMIFFHVLYDLNYFKITDYPMYSGILLYLARVSAAIFVILVGVSLSISYSKVKNILTTNKIILKYLKRGFITILFGIIISIISWYYIPKGFVIFGILHFIGTSIILSLIFIHYRFFNIIFGIIIIILGLYLRTLSFDFNYLIPLGFIPYNYWSIDHFPLLPWFGIILIGITIGNILYPNKIRKFEIIDRTKNTIVKLFCFLGRNSLIIYFLHQPIIILLIYIFLI